MANDHKQDEKIVYVGDSRVRKRTEKMLPHDFSAYPGKSEVFVPNFLLKEWMVAVVVLVGFLMLVISHPAPLGYPADPTNTSFIPMPDWYFLFLYQLLKYPYTSNDYVVLGAIVLPGIMFGALLLAPFLDTGKERRFYRRPIASSLMFLSLIAIVYLTAYSWHHYQLELEEKGITPEHILREQEIIDTVRSGGTWKPGGGESIPLVAEDDPGAEVYQKATCVTCHAADLAGTPAGPTLLGIGEKYDKEAILGIIREGVGTMPAQYETLVNSGLTEDEIDSLANWLAMQKKQSEE